MKSVQLPREIRVALGSILALIFCFILVVENMPDSHTRRELNAIAPVTRASGLIQGWGVFAPNPLRLEVWTFATVTYEDGTTTRWEPKHGDFFFGSPRFERWRKVSTRLRRDNHNALWYPNARNIVEDLSSEGNRVVRVELTREWAEAPLPGDGNEREYGSFVFYDYDAVNDLGYRLGSDYEGQAPDTSVNESDTDVDEVNDDGVPNDPEQAPIDTDEDQAPIGNRGESDPPNVLAFDEEGAANVDDGPAEGDDQ